MTIDVRMVGRDGTPIEVWEDGELVVVPHNFSTPVSIKLDIVDTAYNFASAVPGSQFIITDIILIADKNVTTDTLVEIYEASGPDSTVVDKAIFTTEMLKNSDLVLTGLNWKVNSGKYLNAKTDDDDVFATIAYNLHFDDKTGDVNFGTGEDA